MALRYSRSTPATPNGFILERIMGDGWTSERPKVLVVDDEALARLDLASSLSDTGFDVMEVGNVDDALAILSASDEVAVLITDVELFNRFDGVALAWAVRQKWPSIQIIVVSGRHRANEVELPDRSRFFLKPYNVQRLIVAVRELLAS